jgi:nucleoside-diphosphate-sugar epimerase
MRILVTGGAGYLGSVLVPKLLEAGHSVVVLDRFFFGEGTLPSPNGDGSLTLVRDDLRWVDGTILQGVEAVVDLAALSNDPAGDLDPWKTLEINYLGRSRMARLSREAGVRRYVVSSSCSLYGFQSEILTEDSKANPLTVYARANVLVEADNLPLASPDFCVTALRFATLYGVSPRMRFDLAINGMVLGAQATGKLPVARDGLQWRPFLHVADAARAIIAALGAEPAEVNGCAFNVGTDDQNYQIRPLAEQVAAAMTTPPSLEWYGSPDPRSYRVSFRRFHERIGFEAELRPANAVREIQAGLVGNRLDTSARSRTVEWYRHLLADPSARATVAIRGVVL